MEKQGRLKTFLFRINDKILSYATVIAVRKAMICSVPLFLVSSFTNIMIIFPVPAYQSFLQEGGGVELFRFLSMLRTGADSLMGITMAAAVAHYYVRELYPKDKELSWVCTVISIVNYGVMVIDYDKEAIMIQLGVNTMFISFISGLLTPMCFLWLYDHELLMPTKAQKAVDPTWWWTIKCGPGCMFIGTVLSVATFLTCRLTGISCIYNGVNRVFNSILPLRGVGEDINGFLLILFQQILFLFGMNGSVLTSDISANYFEPLLMENIDAVADGLTPKNIVNSASLGIMTAVGGSGMALALIIAILLVSISSRKKWLAKFALIPSIFNNSEIVHYGLPLAFSPIYAIPFVTIPLLNFLLYWVLAKIGLLPIIVSDSNWMVPYVFQSAVQFNSLSGPIFITLLLVLDVIIYIPFVKLSDEYGKYVIQRDVAELTRRLQKYEEKNLSLDHELLPTGLRRTWEVLLNDLIIDLKENQNIKMYYQPQIDTCGRCIGAEALLRWKHSIAGFIYPPLVIEVAKQGDVLGMLELFIFNEAAAELAKMERNSFKGLKISVNITATSLLRENLVEMLDDAVKKNGVNARQMWVELTEQDAITSPHIALQRLEILKNKGYGLLIDDFGMGHTSIKYLQFGLFDIIKLDGSLTKNITQDDENSGAIISSISKLAEKFRLGIVAEYVENMNQKMMLERLGVDFFQGYLISKPLTEEEFRTFLESGAHSSTDFQE
ncbi:PTS system, lactose/cellobiose family IIC component [Lachnospiraceae bacterium]|nr:PTS system, lactose/cellobiose family IIC component [Lachnospiraceae bacterium]